MNCPRCEGLLMSDQVYNPQEVLYVLSKWRCLNCGENFDSLILQNRTTQKEKGMPERSKSTSRADNRSPLAITSKEC
jgi:hypothetical protein